MLPFDADTLISLYGQVNRALWPAQLAVFVLAAALVALPFKPFAQAGRLAGLVLAGGWLTCGVVFHLGYFAPLNFAAPIYGWCFVAQALLLLWTLALRGNVWFLWDGSFYGWAGLILALVALLVAPLATGLFGDGLAAAELPGLMPDPTALFTLALLLLVRARAPWHLIVLPCLWCLVAMATGWILEAPSLMILPAAGVLATLLLIAKNRRAAV
ncbi:MAG: DUF6064 family protein [Pseudomonadota bacterium]